MTRVPLYSIVIPTYKRPIQLTHCLEAISRLDAPDGEFEVIVVDDGGDMKLDDIISSFCERLALRIIQQANTGPAGARNAGAAHARGTYLAFTDDDCQPAVNWLTCLKTRVVRHPKAAITGKTLNTLSNNLYAGASQLLIDYLYEYFNADPEHAQFLTSNNLALPAEHFHALGGFDNSFSNAAGEDREFCDRWRHHGFQVVFAPELMMYHAHHLSLRSFCRQHFNYGRAAFRCRQLAAQRNWESMKVEALTFYLNLLKYPVRQTQGGRRSFLIAVLFLLSQVSNTTGFFQQYMSRLLRPQQREE
ncbi:MAG: glycosyltransferase family 2 protein [bacterium]|nr:glycosyltransferase family 2 protein [bacterium]